MFLLSEKIVAIHLTKCNKKKEKKEKEKKNRIRDKKVIRCHVISSKQLGINQSVRKNFEICQQRTNFVSTLP